MCYDIISEVPMDKRLKTILELITQNKTMSVVSLSEKLGVSQVTIRKDLNKLEKLGMIKREHGYAKLNGEDNISNRLSYHYEAKTQIALKAIESVEDGETVMIESGSCCALVARALATYRKDITIITNSAFICDYIRNYDVNLILLGGTYQKEAQVTVGPLTINEANNFFVNYYFIGTDGFSEKTGFTGKDYMRCMTVAQLAKQAKKVVIVTESEKFGKVGTMNLLPNHDIYGVVTDQGISEEMKQILVDQEIKVFMA